jgi:hypothetical protein
MIISGVVHNFLAALSLAYFLNVALVYLLLFIYNDLNQQQNKLLHMAADYARNNSTFLEMMSNSLNNLMLYCFSQTKQGHNPITQNKMNYCY